MTNNAGQLSRAEVEYLEGQIFGRLATIHPDGTLQVNPVGFRFDEATCTFEISGFDLAASRKFKNIAANGRAAFVVDDVPSLDPMRVRCLEVRGVAEAIPASTENGQTTDALIRLQPERIISFGIGDDRPPHLLEANSRTVPR